METILSGKIYHVECENDPTVLVAMDVEILDNRIEWFDTIKMRGMRIKEVLDQSPEHFVFMRGDGELERIYTFVPLNLEIYNSKVKSHLINGKDFNSDEELFAAFKETKKDVW